MTSGSQHSQQKYEEKRNKPEFLETYRLVFCCAKMIYTIYDVLRRRLYKLHSVVSSLFPIFVSFSSSAK